MIPQDGCAQQSAIFPASSQGLSRSDPARFGPNPRRAQQSSANRQRSPRLSAQVQVANLLRTSRPKRAGPDGQLAEDRNTDAVFERIQAEPDVRDKPTTIAVAGGVYKSMIWTNTPGTREPHLGDVKAGPPGPPAPAVFSSFHHDRLIVGRVGLRCNPCGCCRSGAYRDTGPAGLFP